jgi:ABC-2 family transporter protein
MIEVLKAIRLDHYIFRDHYKFFLGVYALGTLLAFVTKIPAITIVVVMIVAVPFMSVFFSVYEKNNLSKLYGILPLGRSEVVIGGYLYALLFVIANEVLAALAAYLLSLIMHVGISGLEFLSFVSISFFYFCLYISIQFPFYFHFPLSKVYIFSNLPLYLIIVYLAYLYRRTNYLDQLNRVIQYFSANHNMIWVSALGLGCILVLISISFSRLIYQKHDL